MEHKFVSSRRGPCCHNGLLGGNAASVNKITLVSGGSCYMPFEAIFEARFKLAYC